MPIYFNWIYAAGIGAMFCFLFFVFCRFALKLIIEQFIIIEIFIPFSIHLIYIDNLIRFDAAKLYCMAMAIYT